MTTRRYDTIPVLSPVTPTGLFFGARAGFSFWGMIRRLPEPNAAFCIGVEGETGAFKCLTPSTLSRRRRGAFLSEALGTPPGGSFLLGSDHPRRLASLQRLDRADRGFEAVEPPAALVVGERPLVGTDDKDVLAGGQGGTAFQQSTALPLVLAGIEQHHVGVCGAFNASTR